MTNPEVPSENLAHVQDIVKAYMEDDIVYKVIDFTQKNLYFILTISVLSIISYLIGKTSGERAFSLIRNMKEKYENIEHKKKTTQQLIVLLTKIERALMSLIYLVLLAELALLANVIYVNGLNHHFFFRPTLTRTTMLSLLGLIFLIFLIRKAVNRAKVSKVKHLLSINQDVSEIGKELIEKLGPELVAIIKVQLFGAQIKHTRNAGCQTMEMQQVQPTRRMSEGNPGISKEKMQEMLMKQATKYEVEKGILVKDLDRHKAFMHEITSFEWCDYCSSLAVDDTTEPSLPTSEIKEDEKTESEQGEKGKVDEEKELKTTGGDTNMNYESPFVKKRISRRPSLQETIPTSCTNECLKKYFQMGFLIGERFRKEEEEMKRLKDEYKKLTQMM